MRFLISGVIHTTDLLIALGVLVLLSAGIYSIWLDFLSSPSLFYKSLTLIFVIFLISLSGDGLNKLIQRKLDLDPPEEYWQEETSLHYKQYGNSVLAPPVVAMIYLIPIFCFLPILYSLLYPFIFWILILILVAVTTFCFSHFKYGLIQKRVRATYYPRTQAFIDFYLALNNGEWDEQQEQLFLRIGAMSNDFIVAQQIRALIKDGERINHIHYEFVDVSCGPNFEATPENIAARDDASFESFDAMLKTHEHLG